MSRRPHSFPPPLPAKILVRVPTRIGYRSLALAGAIETVAIMLYVFGHRDVGINLLIVAGLISVGSLLFNKTL